MTIYKVCNPDLLFGNCEKAKLCFDNEGHYSGQLSNYKHLCNRAQCPQKLLIYAEG